MHGTHASFILDPHPSLLRLGRRGNCIAGHGSSCDVRTRSETGLLCSGLTYAVAFLSSVRL